MNTIIENEEDLNYFMPQLISSYKEMFSESPFNNPNITDKYAKTFFKDTFKNGLVFISTSFSREKLSGFSTVIKSEFFKDFKKLDLEENSIYLSTIFISKGIRSRDLGKELFAFVLNQSQKDIERNVFYARTRNDTPDILSLLDKKGFKNILKYPVIINEEELELIVHKL